MKNIFTSYRKYIAILLIAIALSSTTSLAVLATIPDANNVIHGCRHNVTGTLKVIDNEAGQTCSGSETSLNWNQSEPTDSQTAYFSVDTNNNVETAHLRNITSYLWNDGTTTTSSIPGYCLKTSFTPRVGLNYLSNGTMASGSILIKGLTTQDDEEFSQHCSTAFNAFIIQSVSMQSGTLLFE